jgi:putative transposase
VRFWWNRFGPIIASRLRKRRYSSAQNHSNWRWHIDEAFVKINKKTRYLWRAVDHEGEVLDVLVTEKCDKTAARKVLKRLMKRFSRPGSIVTDRLTSCGAAMKELACKHIQTVGRWMNNRAENSHLVFRRKERTMHKFRSNKSLQKFTSIQSQIQNHFNGERHLIIRHDYFNFRTQAFLE